MVDKDGNNLYESNTDSPTWGYFFDGIPSKLDPRALVYFTLPSDYSNRIETGYASFPNSTAPLNIAIDKANDALQINTSFAWNGLIAGYGRDDKAKGNGLVDASGGNYGKTYPALAERYRNSKEFRVFFGPWETFFLLAEAAVRGWNAGMGAQAAYEEGIKASFEYLNVDANYEAYINSEDYNRVGTSVKFTHTAEPKLNDQLTKIITQKFIANTPWLPQENWCDHRRTGLPFWELAVTTTDFPYLMEGAKTAYLTGQKPGCYAQRMNYPNSFKNASPEQYQNALSLMGMTNENTITPLWWAIK